MFRSLTLYALFATALFAQPNPFANPIIRNAASLQTAIAPGSFISITSPNGSFTSNTTFSLTTADGVTAALTAINPPNVPAGTTSTPTLWFVIPPAARVGTAFVTVNGLNTFIEIVGNAPGLFTAIYSSYGPALALNHPSTRNALTSAAVPNGVVSLFATGLNGARTDDVRVELAGQSIVPLYAGPQGQPGLDQINFVVPQDAYLGCYVPVVIRVRGVLSNQATLSINTNPLVCAHPLGLTYSDMKTLDAGGTIPLAEFSVNSDVTPPQAPLESAGLSFPLADTAIVALNSGVQTTDAQLFSCYFANALSVGALTQRVNNPDIGTVTVSGPSGKQLELLRDKYFSADAPKNNPPFFSPGTWRLSASGGSDLGAFQRDFALPAPLQFTNLTAATVIPSQGYTLRWDGSGFGPGDIISVYLNVSEAFASYASCTAPAWAGQLLLPNSILETFKGRSTLILANVRPRSYARDLFLIPSNTGSPIRGFVDYSFLQRITTRVE